MLTTTAAGAEVGVGNALVKEAGAGVGEGITNVAVDTAAAIVARRIAVSGVRTITTVKIVVAMSLTIVTTPLFLLPTINCINGRNAECPM
jgi:hypothetical protein